MKDSWFIIEETYHNDIPVYLIYDEETNETFFISIETKEVIK